MARVLKDLIITEVSSVDRGAGEGVKVMLMKRDGANPGDTPMPLTDAEIAALVTKSVTAALPEALKAATADITKANAEELAKRDREIAVLKMLPAHKAFYDGLKDEDSKKAFSGMDEKGRDAECAKVAKAAEVLHQGDLSDVQKRLDDTAKENADLKKRLDAVDLEKAQADFKKRAADLGLTADGDGELMRKAYGGDKEAQTAFEKRQGEVVKALAAQAETGGLFKNFGQAQGKTGKAYDVMMSKAEDLRKTADGKGLTIEQAFTKVYEDSANVELRKQHIQETAH